MAIGQVDDGVQNKDLNEVMVFGDWVCHNQEDWLTKYWKTQYIGNLQQGVPSVLEKDEKFLSSVT